nr:hypothetical protein [Coprococcus sp. AF21-14LB]
MINSENVLNTAQLEEIVQTFVHEFCKEKRDIHSQNVTWYTDEDQKEKIRQIGFSRDGRPVAEVVEEMMKEVYHYRGDGTIRAFSDLFRGLLLRFPGLAIL